MGALAAQNRGRGSPIYSDYSRVMVTGKIYTDEWHAVISLARFPSRTTRGQRASGVKEKASAVLSMRYGF